MELFKLLEAQLLILSIHVLILAQMDVFLCLPVFRHQRFSLVVLQISR
jgi:hypothetical protein